MPVKLSISAQVPENKEKGTPQLGPATVVVETGETAAESIKMFGDEAVKSNSDANWIVTVQNNIRSGLRRGETQEQMQARLGDAKMGVAQKGVKVDSLAIWKAEFATATPDRQKQMIAELTERAQKK